jgi:hypothetical protein
MRYSDFSRLVGPKICSFAAQRKRPNSETQNLHYHETSLAAFSPSPALRRSNAAWYQVWMVLAFPCVSVIYRPKRAPKEDRALRI